MNQLADGEGDDLLLPALILVLYGHPEGVQRVAVEGGGHEQTVVLMLAVAVLEVTQVAHDGLALVKPLVPAGEHGNLTDGAEVLIEALDVRHPGGGGEGGLVVVAQRGVGLDQLGVVDDIQGDAAPLLQLYGGLSAQPPDIPQGVDGLVDPLGLLVVQLQLLVVQVDALLPQVPDLGLESPDPGGQSEGRGREAQGALQRGDLRRDPLGDGGQLLRRLEGQLIGVQVGHVPGVLLTGEGPGGAVVVGQKGVDLHPPARLLFRIIF